MLKILKQTVNNYVEDRNNRVKKRSILPTSVVKNLGDVSLGVDTLTREEFEQLGMFDKMRALKRRQFIDRSRLNESFIAATSLFLFTVTTGVYMMLVYHIPRVGESVEWANRPNWPGYWLKVGILFIYVSVVFNWLLVITNPSKYSAPKDSLDQPNLRKTLWDDYDKALKAHYPPPRILLEPLPERKTTGKMEMVPCRPERSSGLQWRYCMACDMEVPPRAHHCIICQHCTLKRDHHCFMTGVCIGFHNQRYFTILGFYTSIACILGLCANFVYLRENFFGSEYWNNWLDVFLPVTIYRTVISRMIPAHMCIMVAQMYIHTFVGSMAFAFQGFMWLVILRGITSQEFRRESDIYCSKKFSERITDVFGPLFLINFIIPAVFFRQPGDGISWPKVYSKAGLKLLKYLPNYSDGESDGQIV